MDAAKHASIGDRGSSRRKTQEPADPLTVDWPEGYSGSIPPFADCIDKVIFFGVDAGALITPTVPRQSL